MNIKDNQPGSASELRCRAEKKIRQETRLLLDDFTTLSREEIGELIHELEVHKIELEMQNDELCVAQEELEISRKRYLDLYNLAPVGYCVVNEKGLILNANLTAATLLGQTRSNLINRPVSQFILNADYYLYNRHWKTLFETGEPQTVELQMLRNGKSLFWARLDSVISGNTGKPPVCQVTLTDISKPKRLEHELKKRIKELNLLFHLSFLLEKPGISLEEILEKIVLLMPQAWQFPEITVACIDLEGKIFQTKDFRKTQWMQTSDIVIQGKTVGQMAICYTENRPAFNEGPFSLEESRLLKTMAERLGHIIERVRMTEAVKHSEMFLRTVINSITNPFAVIKASDYTVELANDAYGDEKKEGGLKCYAVFYQRSTPCTGDDYPCPVREVKQMQKPFSREYTRYDDQGNLSSIEIFAFPVLDSNGKIIQVIINEINITTRKGIELKLEQKADELKEMNTALKVLLKRRELDKDEIEQNIFSNYQTLLTPIIQNLKNTRIQENQEEIIKILELRLQNILSPFSKKLSDKLINLTPTEIHVAQLIKSGKSNKEISQILNCSFHTVSRHRDAIRAKTNLKNKKINLRSFLLSLE